MKETKEILLCVIPYVVAAILFYPLMAVVGGCFDPFLWDRSDRMFYFITTMTGGFALMARLIHGRM